MALHLQRQRGERSVELERDFSSAMREAGRLSEALHVARGAESAQPRQPESQLVLAAALREMGHFRRRANTAHLEARLDVLASAQVTPCPHPSAAHSARSQSTKSPPSTALDSRTPSWVADFRRVYLLGALAALRYGGTMKTFFGRWRTFTSRDVESKCKLKERDGCTRGS